MYERPDERYPINWNKLRFYIFKRDNYTCQRCGRKSPNNLQCHHRRAIGMGGSSHPDNLITLCAKCHDEVSRLQRKGR
jgi:5-methylcytosine-specific restriction endonuclease McrA